MKRFAERCRSFLLAQPSADQESVLEARDLAQATATRDRSSRQTISSKIASGRNARQARGLPGHHAPYRLRYQGPQHPTQAFAASMLSSTTRTHRVRHVHTSQRIAVQSQGDWASSDPGAQSHRDARGTEATQRGSRAPNRGPTSAVDGAHLIPHFFLAADFHRLANWPPLYTRASWWFDDNIDCGRKPGSDVRSFGNESLYVHDGLGPSSLPRFSS